MLVLTRRANQSIVIGGRIVVRVLQVQRDQVRLGIDAPRDVEVHREEVFAALEEANRLAALRTGTGGALADVLGPLARPPRPLGDGIQGDPGREAPQ
ncbi:MAG: carbon storage regulator CsrA, partial [Acidimicrobiales bacterium]